MEKMYINGNFVESKTHEYIDVENPATEEILGRVPNGNEYDVEEAVKAASRAQREWGKRPAIERGKYLLFIADRLKKEKRSLLSSSLRNKEKHCHLPAMKWILQLNTSGTWPDGLDDTKVMSLIVTAKMKILFC